MAALRLVCRDWHVAVSKHLSGTIIPANLRTTHYLAAFPGIEVRLAA